MGAGFVGAGAGVDIGVANNSTAAVLAATGVITTARNIDINALSWKHITTYTFAVGAGAVGVGGAVSIWSMGTQPTGSYSDGQGDNGNGRTELGGGGDPAASADGQVSGGQKDGSGHHTSYQGILDNSGSNSTVWGNATTYKPGASVIFNPPDWVSGNTYNTGDTVTDGVDGHRYIANKDLVTDLTPPHSDSAGWALAADKHYVARGHWDGTTLDETAAPTVGLDPASDPQEWRNGDTDSVANGRISGQTGGASTTITNKAPTGTPAQDGLSTPINPGTSAQLFGHATSTGNITVNGDDNAAFGGIVGAAGGGAVGVGASILVGSIDAETTAEVGGGAIVSSGGRVLVHASLQENTSTLAFAGAGGAVGVAAQVSVLNDASTQGAKVDDGAHINQAIGGVDVKAENNNRAVSALTIGGAIGGVAAGVAIGVVNLTGSTKASVGNAVIGTGGTVTSLTVEAYDNSTATTEAIAVAAGIGVALNGAVALTHVHPSEVSARLSGGASINVTGAINVTAKAQPNVTAEAFGAAVAGGAALGVSYARANDEVNVIASVGDGANFDPTSLSVSATLDKPSGGLHPKNTYANAIAGGGGLLLGAEGGVANATTTGTVSASVGNNVFLPDGDLTIASFSRSLTLSDATGVGVGFIGIGVAVADATTNIATTSSLGSNANANSSRNGTLTVGSRGEGTTGAASTAGSGGVIAGNGSLANGADNSSAASSVGATGNTLYGSNVSIASYNEANYYSHADSTNAAVVGASGAFAEFDGNTSATTTLPDNLTINATGVVEISSENDFFSATGGTFGEPQDNVDAAGGGGLTATAAFSTTNVTGYSTVNIGINLNISAVNVPETNLASIGIDAGSQLLANDFIKLETGGAISGAGVNSSLTGHLHSAVNVGSGATLYSTQNIGIGTYTIVVGHQEADSSTWGLAAVGFAEAHLSVDTHESVSVGSGAFFAGLGNVDVRTGDDSSGHHSTSLTGSTSAQSYVRGLIAVPVANASTHFNSNQQTTLSSITIQSGRNTTIAANPHNPAASADGTGHGYELGFIPVTDGSSDPHVDTAANVSVYGSVVAGFYHETTLTIADTGSAGGGFSGVDAISHNTNWVPVSAYYDPNFNPRDFVNNAAGGDKENNALLIPYLQMGTVGTIHLGDLFAAAGNVIIDAQNASGTASLTAYGGPTITVNNHSKDYLVVDGTVTIPFSTGGHVAFEGGASQGALGVSANNVDVGGTVSITDSYGGTYGSPATGPGLILAGEVSNLGGLVDLINDQGNIVVTASIYAASISASAPNGAFALIVVGTAVLGAAPMSEWDNVLLYPGGNPHTALNIANLKPNDAISYVANYEHQGFTSISSFMFNLIGDRTSTNRDVTLSGGDSIVYLGDCLPLVSGNCDGTSNTNASPAGQAWTFQDTNDPHSYFPALPTGLALTVTRSDFNDASTSLLGDPGHTGTPQSQIVAGTAVLISAGAVDLNSHIVVGPPTDWSASLPSTLTVPVFGGIVHVDLPTYRGLWLAGLVASPTVDLPVDALNFGDSTITATYDARTNEVTLNNVKAAGGSGIVRIKGALVNTNNLGQIKINAGLGHVTVDNQTAIPLAVQDIYAGSTAATNASSSIIDLLDTNTGIQTMYAFRPGAGIDVYSGSLTDTMDSLRTAGPISNIAGSTTSFSPQAGWRLEWNLQAKLTRNVTTSGTNIHGDNWIFTVPDDPNNPWQFYNWTTGLYQSADLPDSHLVYLPAVTDVFHETITASSDYGAEERICYENYDGFATNLRNDQCASDSKFDPGFMVALHGFRYPTHATITLDMSVKADNPVGIVFGGHDRGLIDITSNSNVFLDGTLTNPNGDTNITSTNGSVLQPSSPAAVLSHLFALLGGGGGGNTNPPLLTNNLTLSATGGIGSVTVPISATMTNGGVLNATSGPDGTYLALGSGALIGSLAAGTTGNYGDVVITGAGSLLPSGAGTNVSGRNITLNTSAGSIGSVSSRFVIAAHATALANGGFNDGFVYAEAVNDIVLQQVGGDLVITEILSHSGNVDVDVTSGGIYNRFTNTPSQVITQGDATALWTSLQLTSALGNSTLTEQTVTNFENQVERNYQDYWNLRTNGTLIGDTLTLSVDGIAKDRATAAAGLNLTKPSDAQVQAFAQTQFTTLVTFFDANLPAGWRTTGDFMIYNSGFEYDATGAQITDLTKNATWNDNELKHFVNRTALEPAVGSVPTTTPNIFGHDVTLHAYGSIGRLAAPLSIDAAKLLNGDALSNQESAALALAASPGDVQFVGLDSLSQVVKFSYTGVHFLPAGVTSVTSIEVKQLAPLFVGSTGIFNATSNNGTVFVQSTEADLNIGYVSAATDASLTTAQNIKSAGTSSTQIHTGGDLTLLAAAGDIAATHSGLSHTPLVIQVGGILQSAGAAHLLDLQESTGDLTFTRIASGNDSFLSVPNGSLLQAGTGTAIAAANLTINVQNNIGSGGQSVTIMLPAPTGRLFADAGGNVWIDGETGGPNPNGDLNVGHVYSSGGNVNLEADGSILTPDVTYLATAPIHGNTITLTTHSGSIGVLGNDLLVDSAFSGAGVVNASATGGNIYLIETVGDLSLGTVTVDTSGGPHTAHLVAATGNILNGLLSGINVVAQKLWLAASAAIGTAFKKVATAVGDINARASGGGIFIDQTGGVRIGHVLDNHDAVPPQGLSASAQIVFTAHSPITIDEDVVAGTTITITTVDTPGNDTITVNSPATVSAPGNVSLQSGGDLTANAGSTIHSGTEIDIYGDFSATGDSSTIHLNGAMDAPVIQVFGNVGNDSITLHPTSLYGQTFVWGRGGNDLITVDRLPTVDFGRKFLDASGTAASLVTGHDLSKRFMVNLDGQGGADTYVINATGTSDYIVNVHDTGGPGDAANTLIINGEPGDNVFLLRKLFVAVMQPVGDPANGVYAQKYERINYDNTVNVLQVNGGPALGPTIQPHDFYYVDDNSAITVLNGNGQDYFQFGQVFGADRQPLNVAPGDEINTVMTTVGWLSRGISYATTAFAGDGDSNFVVYSNKAVLKLFGGDGNDSFVVRAFLIVLDHSIATSDTIIKGGKGDTHVEYNINAPVSIDGGGGFNTVVVIGTEVADNFVITKDGVMGAGLNVKMVNVQRIEVDGLEGNDHFYVLSTPPGAVVVIVGGSGSDTIDIGGDVTAPIIAQDVNGVSGFINHSIGSSDPAYDGIFAPGVSVNIAGPTAGGVVVTPNPAGTTVYKDGGSGPNVGSYTLQLAVPAPATATLAYLTVAATPDPLKWATQGGKSIQVSTDGINYSDALVLTFDSTALSGPTQWNRTQTIWVKAVGDGVADGQLTSIVSHAIQSTNPDINLLPITNVEVKVIDNNRPGLVVVSPRNPRVVESGTGTSYTVALARSPNAGETVSVALQSDATILALSGNPSQFNSTTNTISFDSTNWSVPFTVSVAHAPADGIVQNERYTNIVMSVSSSDPVNGVYAHVSDQPKIQVDVIDADAPGLLVTQATDELTVSDGHWATYTIQLLKAPAALTQVIVSLLTDGKTLASSDVPDARFHAAPLSCTPSSTAACGPTVVFDSTNWNVPFTVRVSVNPGAPAVVGTQPVMVFPAQPHTLNQMFGPILIEGEQIIDRSLKPGVKLPTELDVPLPVPPPVVDLGQSTDTLNIFNDGSVSNDTGVMGPVTAPGFVALQALYANSPLCTNAPSSCDAGTFGKISGLNMSADPLTFDFGTSTNHNFHTFDAGITYHNMQIVNVMLGQGNDSFTVNSTTPGAITAVNGGGGSDTITVTGGGGPTSPLVVFGDTSQNGQYYDSTTAALTGRARKFTCSVAKPCNNTLDASTDPNPVVLVGGSGNDTIYGGAGGDQIYGGGGNNLIYAGSGNDHIYGNASINIDLSKRLGQLPQVITVVNDPAPSTDIPGTSDPLIVGNNTIYGGAGNDIIIGHKGVITQVPGTNRILTTGSVLGIKSVDETQKANDTITGGSGDSVIIAGSGDNAVGGGSGNDLIFGANALLDRTTTVGDFRSPRVRQLAGSTIYDANGKDQVGAAWQVDPANTYWWSDLQITLLDHLVGADARTYGNNYIAGGSGNDMIFGGLGNDVIQGDGSIWYRATTGWSHLLCGNQGTVGAQFWNFADLVGACRDANNELHVNPSFENSVASTDYIEGGGGNDVIFGGVGQKDIIGGNSDLYSLTSPTQRPVGSALIFGGAGTRIGRSDLGDLSVVGHDKSSDVIVADNGDIFRLVGANGQYLRFNYDNYTDALPVAQQVHIVPQAVRLIDYTPGGPDYNNTVASGPVVPGDLGGPAEIHAEAGDAFIYGGPRNDVIFGGGQNDTIVGGYGNKWISGGAGDACIIGHDGRCYASRVGTAGEPLYGIAAIPAANVSQLITTPGNIQQAVINKATALQYVALLFPYNLDPNHAAPSQTYRAAYSNDIIYGGFGSDSIHAGAGESAITGAEAPIVSYTNNYDINGNLVDRFGNPCPSGCAPIRSDWNHPFNPGNPLGYNPATTKFALYDAADPRRKILLTSTGALDKTGTGLPWILDFNSAEGIMNNYWAQGTAFAAVPIQGNDAIFGDIGNKWIVGGNGRNRLYGGWGDTILDARGTLDFNGGLNDGPVTQPAYESLAFGGAGRDVLIASSGGDRLLDWGGNFNTYLVPFSPFGMATIDRSPSPATRAYLLALSKSDGADQTVGIRYGGTAARNGEPFGELALVQPGDAAWQPQHGAPRDKFVMVHAARDVLRFASVKPIESPGTADPWVGAGAAAAPAAPAAPSIELAALVNSGRQFAVPVVITGLPGLQATYSITDGISSVTGTGTIGPDGLFSPVLDLSSLADGTLTASATLTDALGNTSAPGRTTTRKDAVAPAAPVVSLAAYIGLAIYTAAPLTISGDAGTILNYSLTDGISTFLENPTIGAGGGYSTSLDLSGFNDGTLTLTATLTDAAGNTSGATVMTVTKITGIPAAPRIALNALDDSGISSSDWITNVRSPRFTISGAGTPTIYVNGALYSGQALADGAYTVTATLTDLAGNVSPIVRASLPLRIDTSAPSGSLTIGGTLINGQLATRNPMLALALSFSDSDTGMSQMAVSTNGGSTYGAAVAYAASTMASLTGDGLYTIAVKVTDVAGNASVITTTVRLDTAPPVITASLPAPTNTTFYDVGKKITLTYGATDIDNATTTVVLDGKTTIVGGVIDIDTLTAGTHTIVVTATDGLGNTTSKTLTFTIHPTIQGLINAVNDGAARGLITPAEQASLVWYLQKALGSGAKHNFIGSFNYEVNYQSGKAISAAEAALLLSWGTDLYARTP